jgi:hypothetical protein
VVFLFVTHSALPFMGCGNSPASLIFHGFLPISSSAAPAAFCTLARKTMQRKS